MKEYQEALQLAIDKKYPESLLKLNDAVKVVENAIGSQNTAYHLFLYQRMASIQQILGDGQSVETTFVKCVETAEKLYPQHKGTKPEDLSKVFMWQNNLLKFYLEYNVDQACDYGSELLSDLNDRLLPHDLVDLQFSLATGLSL